MSKLSVKMRSNLKVDKLTIFLGIYALALIGVAYFLPAVVSGVLCLLLIVFSAVRWGLVGGIASALWSTAVMVVSFFSPQYSTTLGLVTGSLAYFVVGIGLGKLIGVFQGQQAALKESEGRYRLLFDNMKSGVAVYQAVNDGEDFIFKDFNQAAEQMEGISKGELLGRMVTEVFPGVEEFGLLEVFRRVWRTGKPEFHPAARYKDARRDGWRENHVYKLPSGEIVAVYDDVTERKKMEDELRRINRTLEILSKGNEKVARAEDERSLLQEVCRLLVEEGGYRMAWVGFAEEEPAKMVRPVAQAGFEEGYLEAVTITWDDAATGLGPTGTAIRTGKPAVCQNMLTDPAYAPWREEALRRGYASSIALPLTDEKGTFGTLNIYASEAEAFGPGEVELLRKLAGNLSFGIEALRDRAAFKESEARYHNLFQQATDGILSVDAQGRIRDCNPSICAMLGYSQEEMLAKNLRDLIPPEELEEKPLQIEQALEGKPLFVERKLRHKDGALVITEASVVRLESGLFLGILRDVSERVRAEEEIRRQGDRAGALLKIASRLNAQLELEAVLRVVCEEVRAALHAPLAALLLYDSKSRAFYLAAGSGLPRGFAQAMQPLPLAAYDELLQKLGSMGLIPDLTSFPGLPYADLFREYNLRSLVFSSMQRNDSPVGVLVAATVGEAHSFPEDAKALLSGLADQAASAIANARLFAEVQQRLRQVEALRNIDMAITGSLDLRVTFRVVLDEVTSLLNMDAAAILRLDPYTGTLKYEAWRGFRAIDLKHINLRLGEGYGGRSALERQAIHIPDLREVEQDPVQGSLMSREGFAAYWAVPLIAKGHVQGVLEVFHREPFDADAGWLAFLETLAGQAAVAVDNAELFHKLERSNVELIRAYDATIEGWAYALDLKDEETEGHSRRVTEMTVRMARKMGMKEEELVHVRRGALLHDIGKMGIPDAILLKPGKLTDEEQEFMRRHPRYALEMLSPIAYLRPALDIPYCHHEKWDGTGYPRGLKGEQIPLAARIFAVVDVYDALTSDRPYRPAWPREQVLEHIRQQSGRHFDPEVVEVFFSVLEEGHYFKE